MDTHSTNHRRSLDRSAEVPLRSDDRRLIARVRGEFAEMPCLSLTAPQAQRLFGLSSQQCERVLGNLVSTGFLAYMGGVFRRHRTT